MFIKLTKLDNSPVWLNASFIVTVEPRRGGGSIVVPIGDGLDYDVRERCEDVLALLQNAPMPTVVPIPVSDCLTKTPADVSPEPESKRDVQERRRDSVRPVAVAKEPVLAEKKTTQVEAVKPVESDRPGELAQPTAVTEQVEGSEAAGPSNPTETSTTVESVGSAEANKPVESEDEVAKTAKKPRARAKMAKEPKAATAKKTRTPRAKKPTLDLSADEVVRIRKMAPGSVNKLKNTLFTQFHVEDPSKTMQALEAHGILSLDRDHVVWTQVVDESSKN